MNRGWWVAGIGLVGVVLAIVLFPRPDTGMDIPDADPTNTRPADFKNREAGTTVVRRQGGGAPAPADEEGAEEGEWKPSPELLAQREWRARPAATYASKILAPFSAIRFTLMKQGTPEARAFADELGTGVMAKLRAVRGAPEDDPLTPLKADLENVVLKINDQPWASDPGIQKHLDRYRQLWTEYETVAAGGKAPPAPPVGSPDDEHADPAEPREAPPEAP